MPGSFLNDRQTSSVERLIMKVVIIACFLLLAAPIEAGTDNAVSSLICNQYIISVGATQSEVLKKCGDPSNSEKWELERVKRDFYRDIPVQSQEQLSQEPLIVKEYVRVEECEYNFGPTRFIYYLRFENGRLKKITVGDYGY